jgi:hypothetical protein
LLAECNVTCVAISSQEALRFASVFSALLFSRQRIVALMTAAQQSLKFSFSKLLWLSPAAAAAAAGAAAAAEAVLHYESMQDYKVHIKSHVLLL